MAAVLPLIRILLVTIIASCLITPRQADAAPKSGQQVPDFKIISPTGQTITFDNYAGHVLIIDFFASWCRPCRQSIPHLVEMNRKYGKQGLHILGLNADEDSDRGLRLIAEEYRITYPLASAGASTTEAFGIRSLPAIFVIDQKGRISEVYFRYSEEVGRSMEQLIKRLLAEQ